MIAVIFEVKPKQGKVEEYMDIAQMLKPELNKISGFISVERFQSITTPGKILSLSFWKSEESVQQWRNEISHRKAQEKGRNSIFENYRLRVSSVIRDYGPMDRLEAPNDSLF